MLEFIGKLKKKPEKEKRKILYVSTFVIMFFIVFFWAKTLESKFSNNHEVKTISDDLKPFRILKENITDSIDSLGN